MPEDTLRLNDFIRASKRKGASDTFLATLLTRRGWPTDDVYRALEQYWVDETGQELPRRRSSGESSRDAFLYLLSFSTLATWAGALGSMLFTVIDYWLPDAVTPNMVYDLRSQVTWQMASMVVALPIYLLVARLIFRETAAHPERLQSGVRKWLTYIALLATAIAMICDLVAFVDYFLKGELTARFVLKVVTVMVICGGIFLYYLASLRESRREYTRAFGAGAAVSVAAALLIGLGVAGTPARQRQLEADRRRVEDLRYIATAIQNYRNLEPASGIPAALDELRMRQIPLPRLTDPQTQVAYEYVPKSGTSYDLCARFSAVSTPTRYGNAYVASFWNHGAGRSCFLLDASKPVPY